MANHKIRMSALLLTAIAIVMTVPGQGPVKGFPLAACEEAEPVQTRMAEIVQPVSFDDRIEVLPEEILKAYSCTERIPEAEEDLYTVMYADAGQRHIVMAVHGTDYDLVGTNDHIESALRLASGGICNVGTLESSSSGFSSFDLNRINGDLASGKWVLAVMSMNYENNPFSHVVVITGHQITGTQSKYDFWDPWDGLGYSFYSDTGVVGNVDDYWCSVISWDYAIYCD